MRHEIERFNADISSNPAVFMAALNGDHGIQSIVRAATSLGYNFGIEDARTYIQDRTRDEDWADVALGVDPDEFGETDGVYLNNQYSDQMGKTIAITNTVVVTEAMMAAHAIGIAEVAAAAIVIGVIVLLATEPTEVPIEG